MRQVSSETYTDITSSLPSPVFRLPSSVFRFSFRPATTRQAIANRDFVIFLDQCFALYREDCALSFSLPPLGECVVRTCQSKALRSLLCIFSLPLFLPSVTVLTTSANAALLFVDRHVNLPDSTHHLSTYFILRFSFFVARLFLFRSASWHVRVFLTVHLFKYQEFLGFCQIYSLCTNINLFKLATFKHKYFSRKRKLQ